MSKTLELSTTRQKAERLFKPDGLERIKHAGLMLIDQEDFDAMVRIYEEYKADNDSLRVEVQRLQTELSRLRDHMQGKLL